MRELIQIQSVAVFTIVILNHADRSKVWVAWDGWRAVKSDADLAAQPLDDGHRR